MAFFDDLTSRLTKVGSTAVQKTQEAAEVAKLNGQISNEEKRIHNLYITLGTLYFQKYGTNPDSELESTCKDILQAQENITMMRNQILEIRSQMICPSCGSPIEKGTAFCHNCGYRIIPAAPQNIEEEDMTTVKQCSCGAILTPDQKFCANCGQKVY